MLQHLTFITPALLPRLRRRDGESHFSSSKIQAAALAYRAAGLSFVPIGVDGSKNPAFPLLPHRLDESGNYRPTWKVLQSRLPTDHELDRWFCDPPNGEVAGLGILGGEVSGGLEIIDFDDATAFWTWHGMILQEAPHILDKIVWVVSPRPGVHGYYRCTDVVGKSQKLAMRLKPGDDSVYECVIETKGEGGFCVAPASPAACHPREREYRYLTDRDLTMLDTLTIKERELVLALARRQDQHPPSPRRVPRLSQPPSLQMTYGMRPGDVFNATATWPEVLEPHGWVYLGAGSNESEIWRRPGKARGASATVNYGGGDLLYVFSSNAEPFEMATPYSKFAAYALLNHDGDFAAAARQLRLHQRANHPSRPRRSNLLADIYFPRSRH